MNPVRHPASEILASYGRGQIAGAVGLVVAAHASGCRICRDQLTEIENEEGRHMAALPGVPLNAGALANVLRRLDVAPGLDIEQMMLGDVAVPSDVAALGLKPRRWLRPGFWTASVRIAQADQWRAYILRAPAGSKLPRHQHNGREYMCVLAGAFHDGSRYGVGDFAQSQHGTEHAITVDSAGPCACLIATERPTRLKGLGWLAAQHLQT